MGGGVKGGVSGWLGIGKGELSYNPGKVGWWEGFEWGGLQSGCLGIALRMS